ncbi:MAG: 16S rRNA (cytosine(967)-C(5))-methyltransferase RsmB [Rubrivivax sp.]|jgi:16S rRNA (cytosine967-C5)-methyltransferase|nr:16S rRNA (cytosine(967)-C(5))-methyltransferase RsmB [Rubrivivax sp.]
MNRNAPALARLLSATADAVSGVLDSGRSLTDLLAQEPPELRPGVQALSFHSLRHWGAVQAVAVLLAPKPPPPRVASLLHVAVALLWPQRVPMYAEHTVVDQAVAAARQRTPAAAGFVNAVLRRFLRERDALIAAVRHDPMAAWNHPVWWVQRLQADWPGHWQALLRQANEHPPLTLRVNARRGSGAAYVQRLASLGIASRLLPDPALAGQALVLDEPRPVQQLPGFAEGEVSVQDAAAQRAAGLLLGSGDAALKPGARVLDACAAPGGKTAQLLERADLDLLALDSDGLRLQRVRDTLGRLRLPATAASRVEVRAGDARRPATWWDGRPFDAILLDAPCTASGIVRRHPDVRWLRRPSDIAALAATQAELLTALWPLLAPGGRLLYATCSLFKAEGEHQIDAFLQRMGTAAVRRDPASPGHLLPLADNLQPAAAGTPGLVHDGFFYALLHKTNTTAMAD